MHPIPSVFVPLQKLKNGLSSVLSVDLVSEQAGSSLRQKGSGTSLSTSSAFLSIKQQALNLFASIDRNELLCNQTCFVIKQNFQVLRNLSTGHKKLRLASSCGLTYPSGWLHLVASHIPYGAGKEYKKCSGQIFACLHYVACLFGH